jgi:hypothetical protein
VFYIIAALFLGVGFALVMATRQRKPQTRPKATTAVASTAQPVRTSSATSAAQPARTEAAHEPRHPRPYRWGRHVDDTPEPQRISREAYLRELAERNRAMQVDHHPTESQPNH